MRGLVILAAAAAAIGLGAPQSFAQGSYPSKPVKLIVPVTTGGPSDLVARILGGKKP
jgi:tripartite-type tricarboxylate transporter receptor subunit TctC